MCALSSTNKITLLEVRKYSKTREDIVKENQKKIKLIARASKVNLDKHLIRQVSIMELCTDSM